MLIHREKSSYLILVSALLVSACSTLQPNHYGKFTFMGKVTTPAGNPIPNAWVKVRGWETLTDKNGRWTQVQVVKCGALRNHMDSFDEHDAILIEAEGFKLAEEKFVVKHPSWFKSCEKEKALAFETVLEPETQEQRENREASKVKPKEHPPIPWPDEKPTERKPLKGGTHL